jgi:CheY-like chemotaxis protein
MPRKTILIVEDELVQLTMVAKLLKSADYDVMEARDGMTAIALARKELPDLVLLDLGLPRGDGFHVMERLQLLPYTAKIPVIVLSSRTPEEAEEPSRLAGAVAYLQKPVNTAKLLRVMAATFGNLAMAAR